MSSGFPARNPQPAHRSREKERAHAEMCAIRTATARLQTEHLTGCEFYILAHPCPMFLRRRVKHNTKWVA